MRNRILLALATAVSLAAMVTVTLLRRLRRREPPVHVAGVPPATEPQPVAPAQAQPETPHEPAPAIWLPESAPPAEVDQRTVGERDDAAARWMPEGLLLPTAAATQLPVNRAGRRSAPTRRQTVAGTTVALAMAAAVAAPLMSGASGPGTRIVGLAQVPHARGAALAAQRAAYAGPAGAVVRGGPDAAARRGLGLNAPAAGPGRGQTASRVAGATRVSDSNAGSAPAGRTSAPRAPSAPSAAAHSSPPAASQPSASAPATAATGAPASSSSSVDSPSAPAPGPGSGPGSPTPVQSVVSTVQSTASTAPSTVSTAVSTVTAAVPPPPSVP